MFYKKLTRKTNKEQNTLRYKFSFWNEFYGGFEAPLTHKLDYIPEQWLAFGFSALHRSLIYDTQSLCQYSYNDTTQVSLRIRNMAWDHDQLFPELERNFGLVKREYARIFLLPKTKVALKIFHTKIIFKMACPFYNIFLITNTTFIRKRVVRNKHFFIATSTQNS